MLERTLSAVGATKLTSHRARVADVVVSEIFAPLDAEAERVCRVFARGQLVSSNQVFRLNFKQIHAVVAVRALQGWRFHVKSQLIDERALKTPVLQTFAVDTFAVQIDLVPRAHGTDSSKEREEPK